MSETDCIDQIEQVDSIIKESSQIDSSIKDISQIDSEIGNVVVFSIDLIYYRKILSNDWTETNGKFTFTIPKTEHLSKDPSVFQFDIINNGVYENAFCSYSVENENVTILVEKRVDAMVKIEGDR